MLTREELNSTQIKAQKIEITMQITRKAMFISEQKQTRRGHIRYSSIDSSFSHGWSSMLAFFTEPGIRKWQPQSFLGLHRHSPVFLCSSVAQNFEAVMRIEKIQGGDYFISVGRRWEWETEREGTECFQVAQPMNAVTVNTWQLT